MEEAGDRDPPAAGWVVAVDWVPGATVFALNAATPYLTSKGSPVLKLGALNAAAR